MFNRYHSLGLFYWLQVNDILLVFLRKQDLLFHKIVSIRDNLHEMSESVFWGKTWKIFQDVIWNFYAECLIVKLLSVSGDVEAHINLTLELVPEWISSVQIKKGKYLKIDRNIDLKDITDKINNIVKSKK